MILQEIEVMHRVRCPVAVHPYYIIQFNLSGTDHIFVVWQKRHTDLFEQIDHTLSQMIYENDHQKLEFPITINIRIDGIIVSKKLPHYYPMFKDI